MSEIEVTFAGPDPIRRTMARMSIPGRTRRAIWVWQPLWLALLVRRRRV